MAPSDFLNSSYLSIIKSEDVTLSPKELSEIRSETGALIFSKKAHEQVRNKRILKVVKRDSIMHPDTISLKLDEEECDLVDEDTTNPNVNYASQGSATRQVRGFKFYKDNVEKERTVQTINSLQFVRNRKKNRVTTTTKSEDKSRIYTLNGSRQYFKLG